MQNSMSCTKWIISTLYHIVFEIFLVPLNDMCTSWEVIAVPYNDPVAPKLIKCDTTFK
jgi:hypothetical protein